MAQATLRRLISRALRGPGPPSPEPDGLPSALALMNQRMLYKTRDDLIVDSLRARPPARRARF